LRARAIPSLVEQSAASARPLFVVKVERLEDRADVLLHGELRDINKPQARSR